MKVMHLKVIDFLYRRGFTRTTQNRIVFRKTFRTCGNLLLQSTGVVQITECISRLEKAKLIHYGKDSRFGYPCGWSLTEKGRKLGKIRDDQKQLTPTNN